MSDQFTIADVYHKLGTLEGKVDTFLSARAEIKETAEDHDQRIRSLEDARNRVWGGAGVISAAVTLFITYITSR